VISTARGAGPGSRTASPRGNETRQLRRPAGEIPQRSRNAPGAGHDPGAAHADQNRTLPGEGAPALKETSKIDPWMRFGDQVARASERSGRRLVEASIPAFQQSAQRQPALQRRGRGLVRGTCPARADAVQRLIRKRPRGDHLRTLFSPADPPRPGPSDSDPHPRSGDPRFRRRAGARLTGAGLTNARAVARTAERRSVRGARRPVGTSHASALIRTPAPWGEIRGLPLSPSPAAGARRGESLRAGNSRARSAYRSGR